MHLFVFLGRRRGRHDHRRAGRRSHRAGSASSGASILGVLPFTLLLPYANLAWTGVLSVIIGLILASAFSAILVYAQELVPGRVGMVSGLFFGFAFGMAGLGAAVLGELADRTSITFVYRLCSLLPALGVLAALLPSLEPPKRSSAPVVEVLGGVGVES